MEYVSDNTREDRLYLKALGIRYERRPGLWLPIMWHLALRRYPGAMRELADWLAGDRDQEPMGAPADGFSAAGLYRRAHRLGDALAAHNAAAGCFNRNDLSGYRQWLNMAARRGDKDARKQLRYFETRLPNLAACRVGRLRPKQRRDA